MILRLIAALIAGALLGWETADVSESGDALASELREAALIGAACFAAGLFVAAWAGHSFAWVRRWPTTTAAFFGTVIFNAVVYSPVDVRFASYQHSSVLVEVTRGLFVRELLFGIPAWLLMQLIVSIGPGLRWLAGDLPPGRQPAALQRLANREDLSPDRMRDEHFPDCDLAEICGLMELFRNEGFPAGRFRPDDDLDVLLEPEPTWNPLRWFLTRPRYEDSVGEIDYRLRRKGIMRLKSTRFRDVVQAWADAVKS